MTEAKESPTAKLIKKSQKAPAADKVDEALGEGTTAVEAIKPKADTKKATVVKKTTKKAESAADLIITTSKEVENLTAQDAMSLAHKLMDETEFNYFKLGGVLSVIQANSFWEGQGFETFKEFMEEELGMPYRKGMYLIQIYNDLVESGVPWESVKGVGWTKLKELAKILTEDNVDGWVAKANSMTTIQLQEEIKASLVGDSEEGGEEQSKVTTVTTLTFKLHDDQKEIVKACLEKAKADFGTEYDAVAIENICISYMESGTGKAKTVTKTVTKAEPLIDTMKAAGWEEAINTFEQAFPTIDISLSVPESEE